MAPLGGTGVSSAARDWLTERARDSGAVVDYLGRPLDEYVASLPLPVHVLRMGSRSGLIRARLKGTASSMRF